MPQQLAPAPIGIDLGTYKSKIAVAKRGGVEVITNEANFRETPCIVGFGKEERHIGESGNIKMKSNFKDTIVAPMRFLGLEIEYPLLRSETRFSPASSNRADGKLKFDVNYQGTKISLLPEQIMAAYLNKLKLIIAKNGLENKEVILSVPAYLTQAERKAFLDAAKIAELKVVRLINDSTAIALDYGLFRKADLDAEKPRNVLFIDYGHSKLGAFACSFTKSQMNVLEQEYTRNAGCRDIDIALYQHYRGVFQKSSGGLDLSQSKKAYVKLMESIEKQRKVLSGNLEHDINIEYLMQDNDLNYTMKRQQFEQIAAPVMAQVKRVLVKVRENLKAKNIQLHSIQLIGGGTRIPLFLQTVKEVFTLDPSRTLNSSESVARGCALDAAIKSPLFKVQDYILNERVYSGVKFYWNFVEGNNYLGLDSTKYPQAQGKFIYDVGAKVPSSKTIKFKRKEPIQILIEYESSTPGFKKLIGYYKTPAQNPKHETFSVSFKIKYTENGLVVFDDCNLIEEWTEETKVPKKKQNKKEDKKDDKKGDKKDEKTAQGGQAKPEAMQVEEEFEIKKSKKQQYYPIKFEAQEFNNLSDKEISQFFTLESEMLNKDNLILETYEKKNQLESVSYKWKQNLKSSHSQYVKADQIPEIVKMLEEYGEWLYNEGANSTRGTYNERLEKAYAKINPISRRYDAYNGIIEEIPIFRNGLNVNFTHLNSTDAKFAHITPEDRQQAFNQIEAAKNWINGIQESVSKCKKWEEPPTTLAIIRTKAKEITDQVRKTMNKAAPKPQPKKEQKKQDPAKPADQKMDVENPSQGQTEKMETE